MRIQCKTGGEAIYPQPGDPEDVHDAMDAAGCTHCSEGKNADPEHHCGRNATENYPEGEGCRPLLIEPMAFVFPARGA